MVSKYDATKAEIDADTERVQLYVSQGQDEEARKLTAAVEQLIKGLPKNQQKRYREALTEAGTPPKVYTPVPVTHSWRDIDGAEALVDAGAEAMAEGVRHHMKGAEYARTLARRALDLRLLIPNRGLPDVLCWSQDARDSQSEMYHRAGQQVEGSEEERAAALDVLMVSVRGQMANVLPLFIRSLDADTEAAKKYFPMALEAYPDLSPTEAVYRAYEEAEMPLSRYTDLERRAMRTQLKRAKDDGDESKILELETALGIRSAHDPEETLSTSLEKLQKNMRKAEKLLPAIPDFPEERKAEIRDEAKSLRETAEKIIEATMPR